MKYWIGIASVLIAFTTIFSCTHDSVVGGIEGEDVTNVTNRNGIGFSEQTIMEFALAMEYWINPDSIKGQDLQGSIGFFLVMDDNGMPEMKFGTLDLNVILGEISRGPNCKDSAEPPREWGHCKTFTGLAKGVKVGKWLGGLFEDCDCIETRTEINGGTWNVFAECCD